MTALLPSENWKGLRHFESSKPFSIHWELRTMLYIGILLLTSGIGVLVYKHIDTAIPISYYVELSNKNMFIATVLSGGIVKFWYCCLE